MVFSFINFLRGYLIVEVNGFFIERFINLCIRRGIFLWDIKKKSKTSAHIKMSVKAFHLIRPAAKKTRTTVRIKERRGLPLILHKYRKRKAFLIGLIIFTCILTYLTSFIWSIEIEGIEKINENQIRNELKACGLDIGVLKYGQSPSEIKKEMLVKIPELSWIWVDFKGTRAFVEVKERSEKPTIVPESEPCNIVATKDGVITDYIVKNGQPVIKKGSIVKKGDLLISGAVDSRFEGIRYFHADASVKAVTWYEKTGVFPLKKTESVKTGQNKKRYSLKFIDFEIPLWVSNKIKFENYDITYSEKQMKLWGDLYLPLKWKTAEIAETNISKTNLSEAEAVVYWGNKLAKQMEESFSQDIQIINKSYTHTIIEDNIIEVKVTIESNEEIGQKKEILKEEQ